jgi:hypothetical protein
MESNCGHNPRIEILDLYIVMMLEMLLSYDSSEKDKRKKSNLTKEVFDK